MHGSAREDTRVEPPWPVEEENERRTSNEERSRVSEDRIRTCAGGQGDVSLCITHFALVFRFSCNRDVPLHLAGWLEAVEGEPGNRTHKDAGFTLSQGNAKSWIQCYRNTGMEKSVTKPIQDRVYKRGPSSPCRTWKWPHRGRGLEPVPVAHVQPEDSLRCGQGYAE
eukprot:scaffold1053_cov332-Pavlova_lutheri.AAC.2